MISKFQLASILILTRLCFSLTFLLFYKMPYSFSIFAVVLVSSVINFLFFLFSKYYLVNIKYKWFRAILALFLVIAFVFLLISFVNNYYLSFAYASKPVVALVVMATAFFCYFRGIEPISRVASIFVLVFIIMFTLLPISLISNGVSFSGIPLFDANISSFAIALFFSLYSLIEVVIFIVLSKYTLNFKASNYLFALAISLLFSFIIIFFVYGILGEVGTFYNFPFFKVQSVAMLGLLRRVDSFLYGFYIAACTLVLAVFLFCIKACFAKK